MAKSIPSFPRLHLERPPEALPSLSEGTSVVEGYCRAFTEHTGWALRYSPKVGAAGRTIWSRKIAGGSAPTSGTLVLEPAEQVIPVSGRPVASAVDLDSAKCLADSFGLVLCELERTRNALWQREAELAAGVPVSVRTGEPHLAVQLEAVLRGGAEAIGCQAAGLYLLDEATSELKLRACYGLPRERLLEPARPLRGALADLEALLGHAVALEDVAALPHWKTPEDFPSAVCVPISSSTTPLGTLWMFSERRRDFSSEETNLVEIIAGRIASDLEREMLLVAGTSSRRLSREQSAAAQWQRNRTALAPPLCDGWQLAAWTSSQDEPAASFYDWEVFDDGAAAAFLGSVAGQGLASVLPCVALQALAKAHCRHVAVPEELMSRVAESFAAGNLGDELATFFFARLNPQFGRLDYVAAGNLIGWVVRETDCQPLSQVGPPLDSHSQRTTPAVSERLDEHDSLVVIRWNPEGQGSVALPTNLIRESLGDRWRQPAAVLLDAVRAALASQARPVAGEVTLLVIKRRP